MILSTDTAYDEEIVNLGMYVLTIGVRFIA